MSQDDDEKSGARRTIPKPVVKKMRWTHLLVWIVPIAAAAAAGFYVREYLQSRGDLISITFNDGNGLRESETHVMYRGVEIGIVNSVELSDDHAHVIVSVRLERKQETFAKNGAAFWVVRPEISTGGITGLNTVLSGPYIDSIPGYGQPQNEFTGLPKAPAALGEGLRVVLHAPRVERLQADAPVYYRGIRVGSVENVQLSTDADSVDFRIFIEKRYAPLVRTNSQFWLVNGIDVKGGLLTGVQMKLDSLAALVSGGVTFNSPDEKMGDPAKEGADFGLFDEPKKDWVNWAAKIHLEPASSDQDSDQANLPSGEDALHSAIKGK